MKPGDKQRIAAERKAIEFAHAYAEAFGAFQPDADRPDNAVTRPYDGRTNKGKGWLAGWRDAVEAEHLREIATWKGMTREIDRRYTD